MFRLYPCVDQERSSQPLRLENAAAVCRPLIALYHPHHPTLRCHETRPLRCTKPVAVVVCVQGVAALLNVPWTLMATIFRYRHYRRTCTNGTEALSVATPQCTRQQQTFGLCDGT